MGGGESWCTRTVVLQKSMAEPVCMQYSQNTGSEVAKYEGDRYIYNFVENSKALLSNCQNTELNEARADRL